MSLFELPLPPTLNRMYRPNFNGMHGVRKTTECRNWENEVQWVLKGKRLVPIPKSERVTMSVAIFYKNERDIDSSQKALQDCLQGFAYEDDSQIDHLVIKKHKDNANPRIVVEVYPSPPPSPTRYRGLQVRAALSP